MANPSILIKDITLKDLFFSFSLYQNINIPTAANLIFLDDPYTKIDYYSPALNENTTFRRVETIYEYEIELELKDLSAQLYGEVKEKYELYFKKGGYCIYIMECTRTNKRIAFSFFYDNQKMMLQKIGQFPSLASFQEYNFTKDFKKFITKEEALDLSRANGLYAHGIGAGSLVYLRRVFENIIWQTWQKTKVDTNTQISDEEFKKLKMDKKIDLLKNDLPEMITQNSNIYGLLSLGIHELDEEKCKQLFPVLNETIKVILEEKLEKEEKIEREKQLKAALNNCPKSLGI